MAAEDRPVEFSKDLALGTETHKRARIAKIGSIVAIPILLFLRNSLFIPVGSMIVELKTAADLFAYAQEASNEWVLMHPTPAIHHAYAPATYFYASTAVTFLFLWAVLASQAMTSLLRRRPVTRALWPFFALAGILLAILG